VIKLGIAGTDTEVGKTVVAAAIISRLRARGLRVAAMKPIETGVPPGTDPPDATLLRAATGNLDPATDVCPFIFADPVAPLVAASRTRRAIDLVALDAICARLTKGRDAIVVESAGGLLTPIADDIAYDGLFRRWELDLVIVAANRLGALNHTLLTVQAAERAQLRVRAVVLNELRADAPDIAMLTNLTTLRRLLPRTLVLSFPYVAPPHNFDALSNSLSWDL
jgi:dethiobiotin synthetase